MDVKALIGEVAARHGVRLEPDDPAFLLVTLNRLILSDIANDLEERLRATMAEFIVNAEKLEKRVGRALGQVVKDAAAEAQQGLRRDIGAARSSIPDVLRHAQVAQTRSVVIRWTTIGIVTASLIFLCGVIVGKMLL